MCIASVVPVVCERSLLELLFMLLYHFDNFVGYWCELWVSVVLFPDSASVLYSCSCVFRQEFLFVAYFSMGYIVLVGSKYSIRQYCFSLVCGCG